MLSVLAFIAFIVICFFTYDRFPKKFALDKTRLIIFIITIAILILWYIDTESGKFGSGIVALAILSLGSYWFLALICSILNFCTKVYLFYKSSKKNINKTPYIISREMSVKEAREILNVGIHATYEEIMKSYLKLVANNEPLDGGSPYTGAKIENARKLLLTKLIISN